MSRDQAPARAPEPVRKGGFWPLLFGGVLAAAIGAAAVFFLLPQLGGVDAAWRDEVAGTQETQSQEIADLRAQMAELPPPAEMPDLGAIEATQESLAAEIKSLSDQLATFQSRLSALESRPTGEGSGVSEDEFTDLQAALQAQKEQIDALTAAAEARREAAESAATDALRRAALTRIRTALDTGAPFDEALGDLEATGADIPENLRSVAAEGVPTLPELQADFPPAARIALRDARKERAEAGEAETGVMAFLGEQLGARSLEPREGDDPDAVLSRVEAALREGRLHDALAEIDTLPASGQAALQTWAENARSRLNAVEAADALGAQLN